MATRDLTPLMQKFRNLVNRRELKNYLRFETKISKRSIPAPNIPLGVSGAINKNYFYTRDGRRGVKPPSEPFIYGIDGTKQLAAGEAGEAEKSLPTPKESGVPQPGERFTW